MYSFCLYENRSRCLETKKLNQFFIFLLLKELIRSMLEVEVDQRYTALQVLEHPWVTVSIALVQPLL